MHAFRMTIAGLRIRHAAPDESFFLRDAPGERPLMMLSGRHRRLNIKLSQLMIFSGAIAATRAWFDHV